MCPVWCSSIQGIYAQLMELFLWHLYMCIVYIYIHLPWVKVHILCMYRSATRCATFGVAVFKVSMLN